VGLVDVVHCYECLHCSQTYSKASNVDRHTRKEHGITRGGRTLTEEKDVGMLVVASRE